MTSRLDLLNCPLEGINLIEASAGTGKTWNICGLYLRLLLEKKLSVQQILVVTFTIAATAELRERIRARIVEALSCASRHASAVAAPASLGGRSADPSAETSDPFIAALVDGLLTTHGYTPRELANRLELALQTFDEASIFTIHGFCQRALSDTAFSAGRPFEFELTPDDSEIIVEAVNDFWRRRIAGEGFSPALAALMMEKRDSPQNFATLVARHMAKPLARSLWPAAMDGPETEAVDISALEAAYEAARIAWAAEKESVVERLAAGLSQLNANTYKEKSLVEAAAAWDQYFLASSPIARIDETKAVLFCAANLRSKTNKNKTTPTHPFCDRVDDLLHLHAIARDGLTVARLRLIRSLLDEVGADLPRRKRERRVIAFNDMLSNLHAALHDKRYPWLEASLLQRFPAALIDEFQDTDPLQFRIFDAIYGKADGSLFMVGDPKQAIYSFRHADLYTYLDARKRAGGQYTLEENQRSTPGLISAINGLFESNARAFMLDDLEYQAFSPGRRKREALVDTSHDSSRDMSHDRSREAALPHPDLHVWMLPAQLIHRSDVRQRAVQATAAEIARLLNESKAGRVRIGNERLRPKDIAILVRSHAQGSDLKRALAMLNIGSVELLQESVFASTDAEEVERVLMAIVEPSRLGWLRAALATEMIGLDAAAIIALSADESKLMERIERFAAYRDAWTRQGVGAMFRQLLTEEGASARLLCRPDGERRLTNLLHLGEELHKAAQIHDTPDALLRWLQSQRRDASTADATQLRLESDQNLVQIATIHKAKGLEFPIVFCPFLWDGYLLQRRALMETKEYHGDDGAAVIDFRTGAEYEPHKPRVTAQIRLEDSAELLRLMYVAMTRAVYRCYLVAGPYGTKGGKQLSSSESCKSLLNWLVAGNAHTPEAWIGGAGDADAITAAWTSLAQAQHPHIQITPLPDAAGTPVAIERPAAASLVALVPPSRVGSGWRMSSFSGLASGASNEAAATDHDARTATAARGVGPPPASIAPDDILRFPRGSNAGDCLHAVFERVDFTNASTWDEAIAYALSAHPQPLADARSPTTKAALSAMIARMLVDVTSTPLPVGIALGSIPLHKRLTELEFSLSSGDISASDLNRLIARLGYSVPKLAFGSLEGYLKGFIDLVFEHDGRFYVVDWKSNHLGFTPDDYDNDSIEAAMVEHGYHLQHLIYSLALDRYLAHRMAGYDYDSHFGGVLYLFVRGVRPGWKDSAGRATGVFHHRPARAKLEQLERFLLTSGRKRA